VKVQANAVASHDLWHSHLGLPSSHALSMLSQDSRVSNCCGNNKVKVCDVCLCAKQTRSQFTISESNADVF